MKKIDFAIDVFVFNHWPIFCFVLFVMSVSYTQSIRTTQREDEDIVLISTPARNISLT